jgi:hypothetical protein
MLDGSPSTVTHRANDFVQNANAFRAGVTSPVPFLMPSLTKPEGLLIILFHWVNHSTEREDDGIAITAG